VEILAAGGYKNVIPLWYAEYVDDIINFDCMFDPYCNEHLDNNVPGGRIPTGVAVDGAGNVYIATPGVESNGIYTANISNLIELVAVGGAVAPYSISNLHTERLYNSPVFAAAQPLNNVAVNSSGSLYFWE